MSFIESVFLDSPVLNVYGFLIRSLIIYLFLLLMTRLMGPVEMGEMTAIDFIAAITIGSIASAAMVEGEVHFLFSLMHIALWSFLTIALNIGGYRFPGLRRVIVGRPIILIKKGKVLEKNLAKAKMNFDDLMSSLRLSGVPLLEDVEFAILEPRGEVSIVKKSQKQPITPEKLKGTTEYQGIPSILILKGKIAEDNLVKMGRSIGWLKSKLRNAGVDNLREVAVAQVDSNGNLYIDLYDDQKEQPVDSKGKELVVKLQKISADLSQYALESNEPYITEMYTSYAGQLEAILKKVRPFLLEAEEI